MKITPTSNTCYDTYYGKNNIPTPKATLNNKVVKSDVSFGGAMSPVNRMFKFIESAGFFIEFLIIDTLSMVLPRTLVGLNRDKEKLGHPNYQAGAEEFGRESLSGPSMNLIPMLMASVAIHKMLPSIKLDQPTLEGINYSLLNAAKNKTDLSDKTQVTKKLANQIFDDAFAGKELEVYRTRFVETLEKATQSKPKLALMRGIDKLRKKPTDYDIVEEAFDKLVVEMNNKVAKEIAPENPHVIQLKKFDKEGVVVNAETSSKTFFEDFHNYSKDIVEKFLKRDKSKTVDDFLKAAAKKASIGRITLASLAFLAVGGFLLYLPKLYQIGKTSPAQQSAQRAEGGASED